MSDRCAITTEYIYCKKCLEAVKSVLMGEEIHKYLCCQQITSWEKIPWHKKIIYGEKMLPIIAGKIGSLGGEEAVTFEFEYMPKIEALICHTVKVVIVHECSNNGNEVTLFNCIPEDQQK